MLCDDLEGWDGVGGGRELRRRGHVYLLISHEVMSDSL